MKLFGKDFMNVAQKKVLKDLWFIIQEDYYRSEKLSSNLCFHKRFSNGIRLSYLTR